MNPYNFNFSEGIENGELEHLSKQDAFRCGLEFGMFLANIPGWIAADYPPWNASFNNDNADRIAKCLRDSKIPLYRTMQDTGPTVFHIHQEQEEIADDDDQQHA